MFITFEGIEGCGKTTQSKLLSEHLERLDIPCVHTREPGGTASALKIREVFLEPDLKLLPQTELALVIAARNEHLHNLIIPALKQGKTVICDRFFDSTIAYQGYGHQLGAKFIEQIHDALITPNTIPNLTFILDMQLENSIARIKSRGKATDRMENLDLQFHQRVAIGFREIAAQNQKRCVLLDATLAIEEIAANIASITIQKKAGLL